VLNIDTLITEFDKGLRTLFAPARGARATPGEPLAADALAGEERREAAALMRVNHTGEVCAQALYQGQALTAREPHVRAALERAALEETEHLAWTEERIAELGGGKSVLNPLFYAGSLAMGAASGLLGDRWNLGFLAETEHQVVRHLESHLARLPAGDHKSRAIVRQMRDDEARHATTALAHGGAELPAPVKSAMRLASKVMTETAYRV
jgi:ubiquinone biosynthesis monooxygenase Coq7